MKFNFVKWKNFRSYGDYVTQVPLEGNSAKLIVGANGAGKSTTVEAILWCIYGKSLSNVEEVVNRHINKNCFAEVGFEIGQDTYSISRYRNDDDFGNKIIVYKNGEDDLTKRNSSDTQNLISDIIQIPYYAMVASIVFSSEIYISFLRAKYSDRLKVFEGILNLKPISLFYKLVGEFLKPVQEDLNEKNNKQNEANKIVETLKDNIANYTENTKKVLLDLKKQKESLEKEEKDLEVNLASLTLIDYVEELKKNEEYDIVVEWNNDVEEELKGELFRLAKKNAEINKIEVRIEGLRETLEKLEKIDVTSEIELIDKYNEIIRGNKEIDNRLEVLQLQKVNIEVEKSKLKTIQKESENSRKEGKKIKENFLLCPTCNQKIEEELGKKLYNEWEERHEEVLNKEAVSIKKIVEDETINNEKNLEIQSISAKKQELPPKPKYDDIKKLKDVEKNIVILNEKIALSKQEKLNVEKYIKELTERISKLNEKTIEDIPEKSGHDTEFLRNLKEEIETLRDRLVRINNEKTVINEKARSTYDKNFVKETGKKVDALNVAIKKNEKKINKIKDDVFHYSFLQEMFSNKDQGIKKVIIEKMISIFNERINFYLPLFFDVNTTITFDRNLVEDIKIEGKKVSFSTFSSGEKTRLELSIAFSLFMLVKAFFSSEINLLVFDEILDMNLDEKGVQSVLEIIDNLSKMNSVLIISHRAEYKDFFSNQILVRKGDNRLSEILIS